ncbi:MAG: multidrug efflux RND transporter permease subunit [Gemmataceae bacterium]
MASFFIDRPIFATVLSVLITLAGGLAVGTLPLAQYPVVTPPTVQVDCQYPGASSKVVAETVAAPIEQRVNGVEGMMYMSSQSTSDGSYTLSVTFEPGTDLNLAQIRVQNRLNLAQPELPDVVRATGVTIRKRSPELTLTASLNSPDGKYDQLYLSNYALTRIKDELSRVEGISDVTIFGQRDYAMRVWIDPDKLAARELTPLDVVSAVRGQNAQVSVGHVGQPNGAAGQPTQVPLSVVGRLTDEAEFGDIVVKGTKDGKLVRLRDVARVELGAKAEDVANRFDRKPTIGLAIFLLPDANALAVADEVKAKVAELSKDFPDGMRYEIGYDTTPFIRESIGEVLKSLRDSIILVAIVVLVFLQSWRAALIPLAAVPVAIVGTFAAMWAFGFGLNNLTLFGLVLAVGIVVDDAIVVVEAVQHQMDLGHPPREATVIAMGEVSGPIVAVGAVLVAVFLPCAFFSGIVGSFFRQFALTITVSAVISTFSSLSLSPALAALLLKGKRKKEKGKSTIQTLLNFFLFPFSFFLSAFGLAGRGYVWAVGKLIRVPLLVVLVYAGLLGLTYWGYLRLPTGFIPQQDKGYLIASIQLPDAAAAERTRAVIDQVSAIALDTPGVAHVNAIAGNSFVLSAYGSNFGSMFIILDGFDKRRSKDLHADVIAANLRARFARGVPAAQVNVFPAPAVSGLGRAGGVKLMVEDRGDLGPRALAGQTDNLVEKGNQQPSLTGLFTSFNVKSPQVYVDVDPAACASQGVNPLDLYATMQATLGARYVNDFNRFGRTWQVSVQADQRFRNSPDDIRKLKVRNARGQLVPIGAVADVKEVAGPLVLSRYNMYPAAAISGNVSPGTSSGDGLAVLERLAAQELPDRMATEWTELAFIENRSRDTGLSVFAAAVVAVFLILAFLYESWALPLAVILVVPLCVSASLVGVWAGKQDVNIFTQVGFVVLIGLACKNAILIVEFAKRKRAEGLDRRAAVLAACDLRLRPILMTSIAFILGVLPLVLAHGAGAEMRIALGTAVFAGMIGVTVFGVFLTPVFFVVVDRLTEGRLFHRPWVRRAADGLRWAVALGFVGPLVRKAASVRVPQMRPEGVLASSSRLCGVRPAVMAIARSRVRRVGAAEPA